MKIDRAHLGAEKACLDACLDVLDVERKAALAVASS